MEKRGLYIFFIITSFLILMPFVSAPFGYDNPNLPRIDPTINYTEIINWVNDTNYWAGHPWSDTRWLNIDGSNANQNINIGAYNFSASEGFFDDLNVTGNWCNQTNCYTLNDFLTGGGGNPFDQWLNTTSNVTFDNLNLSGRGMFFGGVDEDISYNFSNVRLGVYASTPRLLFENWNGTNWTLWQIDHGGGGLRFYKAGEYVTLRLNATAGQFGESGHRKNLFVYGDIITIDPAGGGGNLYIDGNANITENITANYFIGDGRFLTNLNIGLINSTSWNRSGVNVTLANIGDFVGIGTNTPIAKLNVIGNISFDTGIYDFIVSGWENNHALYVDGSLGSTGFGMKPNDAFVRLQVANSLSAGVGMNTYIYEDTYSTSNSIFPDFMFRKSDSNTIGTKAQTDDDDYLGRLTWKGVDAGGNFDYGAMIQVYQEGVADTRVPTKMEFRTFTSTGQNENQLVLEGSSGYIGINTEFPQNTLNVIGDLNVTEKIIAYQMQQYLFAHTSSTPCVASPGVWINITFDKQASLSQGISHIYNDATNDTFTITETGIYDLHGHLSFQDSAVNPDSNIVFRFIKNGVEIGGSLREKDLDKKDWDTLGSTTVFVSLTEGDEIKFQFTSDDTTVCLESDNTYGVHKDTAVIKIKRIV